MTPYTIRFIPQDDISMFNCIRDAITRLPDLDLGIDETGEKIVLSCHMLARAVGKVFSVPYVDGYFYPNYQHSWNRTDYGNVIDPYPVGIVGGPILVHGSRFYSPSEFLYLRKGASKISNGRFSKPSFRRAVRQISTALADLVLIKSIVELGVLLGNKRSTRCKT